MRRFGGTIDAATTRRGGALTYLAIALGVVGLLAALLLPALRSARPAARRSQCAGNLKAIGLALRNYKTDHGTYPPVVTVDEAGLPLHSWRTLLLPYLRYDRLYEAVDLSKPWDDPANEFAAGQRVPEFECVELFAGQAKTIYFAPRPFPTDEEAEAYGGLQNVPLIVEGIRDHARPWMESADFDRPVEGYKFPPEEFPHHGVQAVMGDGRVIFLNAEMVPRSRDPEAFRGEY